MKRILTDAGMLCAVTATLVLAHITPGAADGWAYRHHHYRHRVAYVEYAPDDGGACRVGWWQTLRYGHVRPRWGTWCR